MPTLRRPCSLAGAGCACSQLPFPRLSTRSEGARDARGPNGPTDLDASQHRGMLKSGPPSRRFGAPTGIRKSAQPKASRARCFRFAPCRPRWTSHFRQPASPLELEGCLSTAAGPGRAGEPVTGCRHRHHGAQRRAAGTPGRRGLDRREGNFAPHLRRPLPATAPRPASGDADQTPLATWGGMRIGIHTVGIMSRGDHRLLAGQQNAYRERLRLGSAMQA